MSELARKQRQIDFFHSQRSSASRLAPVPVDLRPSSKDEAYEVLLGVHERMLGVGLRQTGYKVGCTTPETQKEQGTDEPTWAGLFAVDHYATIEDALAALSPPFAVECEIVFRLGSPISATSGLPESGALLDAVETCMIGCEIVHNRYGVPRERGLPTLIADDFFQAGYVLGPPVASWRELDMKALNAECHIDGRVAEAGRSDIVLGEPLNALRWLAADLGVRGRALKTGDIVFSGSITKPLWLEARPRLVELRIAGLGELR